MGSWERDTDTLSALTDGPENGKRKVLVLVSIATRQGTCPHHQSYCLSVKKTSSIEKVFLMTNQKLVLAQWSVPEEIAFLVFDMCV